MERLVANVFPSLPTCTSQVALIDTLVAEAANGADGRGQVVQMHPVITRLTLDIICQVS